MLSIYFLDIWNAFDLSALILFIPGTILFYAYGDMYPAAEEIGRIFLALSLLIYYIRLLNMFQISQVGLCKQWITVRLKVILLGKFMKHCVFGLDSRSADSHGVRNVARYLCYQCSSIAAGGWFRGCIPSVASANGYSSIQLHDHSNYDNEVILDNVLREFQWAGGCFRGGKPKQDCKHCSCTHSWVDLCSHHSPPPLQRTCRNVYVCENLIDKFPPMK